jgi:integrase
MEFTIEDINYDRYVQDFYQARGLRLSSQESYNIRLKSYCNFLCKSPKELLDISEKEQEDLNIKMKDRKIKRYLLDYADHLRKNGRSESTIKGNLETVKAFYHEYEIETPRIRVFFTSENQNMSYEELPTKEHIKKALKVCGVRAQALVLLHYTSGMGASEVRNLTYGNFIDAMDDYLELDEYDLLNIHKVVKILRKKHKKLVGTWKIKRYKTGMPYITFNSPESNVAILDYLLERIRKNKKIRNLQDPLFVSHFNQIMSSQIHSFTFKEINDRAGFGLRNKKRYFFTSHMLRKLFTTTLYKAKVDELPINWMLGHKINPITESYFKADVKSLKKHYLKALNELSLENFEVKTVTSKEYDYIIDDSKKKDDKIAILEKKLEEMSDRNKLIDEKLNLILTNKTVVEELNKR